MVGASPRASNATARFHVKRSPLASLEDRLQALQREGLRRQRPVPYAGARPSFCSNDYLGLAGRRPGTGRLDGPVGNPAGAPWGAGASRLVVGESAAHLALESALAGWLGFEAALTFSSGYAANVGLIASLAERGDLIVSDALNHASIIDGCRLSGARVAVVPHLDVAAVAATLRTRVEPRAWVVTESYFSMDADSPDLGALRQVCDEAGAALVVDEAHAVGVLGPGGRGLAAAAGVAPDAYVGTLGKALGRQGAFVAGSAILIDWLWNRARSFVFSTGLSPALAASAFEALSWVRAEPDLARRCLDNAEALRAGLRASGAGAGGHGPIVPLIVGDPAQAVALAEAARAADVHVQAIRPPTVPAGTARVRLTATAAHSSDDIHHAVQVLGRLLRERFT